MPSEQRRERLPLPFSFKAGLLQGRACFDSVTIDMDSMNNVDDLDSMDNADVMNNRCQSHSWCSSHMSI